MALERTLCIIKPDAVRDGNIGNIIAHIQKEGFKILGLKMLPHALTWMTEIML